MQTLRSWILNHYVLLAACLVISGCSREKSVLDGVYTSDQAIRGRDVYNAHCAECHSVDVDDFNRRLQGPQFIDNWREDVLKSLFDKIRTTMPEGMPSTLSDQQYVDVLTFILKSNGYPEGRSELTADVLEHVQVVGRGGPAPLPDGALVKTLGRLTKLSDTSWRLTNASRLARTRSAGDLTSDEMKVYEKQEPGRDSFVLSSKLWGSFPSRAKNLPSLVNHRVFVVGRLKRKGTDVYIEVSSVQEMRE